MHITKKMTLGILFIINYLKKKFIHSYYIRKIVYVASFNEYYAKSKTHIVNA